MELTYKQLEKSLISHFRISPDKEQTFRSRIKQLQRLNFPPGVNVGRGAKMVYQGEHLFKLVTAFEFLSFGFPAQAAVTIASDHWHTFAGGYALAALQEREFENQKGKDEIFARITISSLHELQFAKFGEVRPSEVKIYDHGALNDHLVPNRYNQSFSRMVLSIGCILRNVIELAGNQAGVKASTWDPEFHDWLPKGESQPFIFKGRYPDRSNLKHRAALHRLFGQDPDSLTADGVDEAQEFIKNGFGPELPF